MGSTGSGENRKKIIDKMEYDKILDCIHCGLCLNVCPTYLELGLEQDSARGRIYLMRMYAEDKIEVSESFIRHIDLCLICRACEPACPSGVNYSRLVETAREILDEKKHYTFIERCLKNLVYKRIMASRKRLAVMFWFIWLYQKTGIQFLVRKTRMLKVISKRLYAAELLLPGLPIPSKRKSVKREMKPFGEKKYRVGFLKGCIGEFMFIDLNIATIDVLQRNGCEVVVPDEQVCCGALHIHGAERESAKNLARKNIDVFGKLDLDAVVVNAAGCSAFMKEYPELLEDDEDYRERAEKFSKKVKDISEFLFEIGINEDFGELPVTAAYHDSCHLANVQGIKMEPRALLKKIPGLELKEIEESEICCGSAGVYNVLRPDMAQRLLKRKMDNIYAANAGVVTCGNTGCMIQLMKGARGNKLKVLHTVELIDMAYKNKK